MNLSRPFVTGMLALIVVLGAKGLAQDQPQLPPPAPVSAENPDAPIRVNVSVDLVNLATTVFNADGTYMNGLRQDDFTVLENGVEQKLAVFSHDSQLSLSVGVLVDVSGSMRHKLQQALQMVREVALALSPEDEMFVITFNDDVNLRQRFTRNPDEVQRTLRGIRSGGETAVYDAIRMGLEELNSARNGKRVLLLISDGFDTRSKTTMDEALDLLKRSQVVLWAIGIDDDDNDPLVLRQPRYHVYHFMLGELTNATGGTQFRMYTGRNYPMDQFAATMFEQLHQQYTLGYYPTAQRDGSWRKLEVRVNRPGVRVSNRSGYYAIPTVQD